MYAFEQTEGLMDRQTDESTEQGHARTETQGQRQTSKVVCIGRE